VVQLIKYYSGHKVKKKKMGRECSKHWGVLEVNIEVLWEKTWVEEWFTRPRLKWEDIIKMDIQEL